MAVKTFQRGSSTFPCGTCNRLTRYTGSQSLGNKICPQCFELAGIENEISDGYCTAAERLDEVLALTADVTAKGGSLDEWNGLLQLVRA